MLTPQIHPIRGRIHSRSNHGTNSDRKLNQPRLENGEVVGGLVGGDDAAEEEEEYAPGKGDPEREGGDDGFGEEHFGGSAEADFKPIEKMGFVAFGEGVDGAGGLFAEGAGAFSEDDVLEMWLVILRE